MSLNKTSMLAATSLLCWSVFLTPTNAHCQENSVARFWMDAMMDAIKEDGNGPTVHARNYFHLSAAMYDVWAIYHPEKAETYFMGQTIDGYNLPFDESFDVPKEKADSLCRIAISYAAFRLIWHRFEIFGSKNRIFDKLELQFESFGGDANKRSMDYLSGSPEALGNYVAEQIYLFGLQDGSFEEDNYNETQYRPVNPPLKPEQSGNPNIEDKNRWQPISIGAYVEQHGRDPRLKEWHQLLIVATDEFLTPEWGKIVPFALDNESKTEVFHFGDNYPIYHDPGPPPLLDYDTDSIASEQYKWGFTLNALWSGLLDPSNEIMLDISPGNVGNSPELPASYADFPEFYDLMNGGSRNAGIPRNPRTKKPYEPNVVPLGDYARVTAEFWVDGVNTTTPPGHWIEMLNRVTDHPDFERKWNGKGKTLELLEWEVKAYITLAGALHDAAIACWGVKGFYDYVRPISAIRYMADRGQSTDPELPHYHREGLPLIKGHIELVGKKDPLAGKNKEHVNKVKLFAWKGPDSVANMQEDVGGVGWILAENWWPYQHFSFTTPPFAGYTSGHSTYSSTSAEVLTFITGDPFFPGGLMEETFKKDSFLKFEKGPSQDITLQWATYRDAANETCLSRIWGGIHPPCDDIMARKMGVKIASQAVKKAETLFQ